jgi:hypothetical protein
MTVLEAEKFLEDAGVLISKAPLLAFHAMST